MATWVYGGGIRQNLPVSLPQVEHPSEAVAVCTFSSPGRKSCDPRWAYSSSLYSASYSHSQAALSPVREERAILPGSQSRPADIFLRSYHNGLDCAIDVTVISPVQKALLVKSAEVPGHALTHAFDRKMRQNFEECRKEGVHFMPLPIETFGGFHEQSVSIINKIGTQLAKHTGRLESEVISHLYQRLGILLVKGNSALVLSRSVDAATANIDGDIDFG